MSARSLRLCLPAVSGPLLIVVLLILAILCVRRALLGYPPVGAAIEQPEPRETAFLAAAAEAMYPAGGAIPIDPREADVPGYVDRWFRVLHPSRKFEIRLLIAFFEHATLLFPGPGGLRGLRRFSAQPPAARSAILRAWHGSRLLPRRLLFMALRAVLTMGYLGHPSVLRSLRLAPFDFPTPVCEADLMYPPIGEGPDAIPYTREDLTPPSDGTPIDLDLPLHPDYREPVL